MSENRPSISVDIEKVILPGSSELQRVALVYIDGEGYRVYAPSDANGYSIKWVRGYCVRQLDPDRPGTEIDVTGSIAAAAIRAVQGKLERIDRRDEAFCAVRICLQGHVLSSRSFSHDAGEHCTKCGSVCISVCEHCRTPIRGMDSDSLFFFRPSFCHQCGRAYPWMADKLDTARELLEHDDKLSDVERGQLWGLLQYVMTSPKADLAPAKRKLIGIKLETAAKATRELLLDLIAKYAAEMSKSG